jgi:hypothetical protein
MQTPPKPSRSWSSRVKVKRARGAVAIFAQTDGATMATAAKAR